MQAVKLVERQLRAAHLEYGCMTPHRAARVSSASPRHRGVLSEALLRSHHVATEKP